MFDTDTTDIRWLDDPREIAHAISYRPPPPEPSPRLAPIRLRHAWRIARAKCILNRWIEPTQQLTTLQDTAYYDAEDPDCYWKRLPRAPRPLQYADQSALLREIDDTPLPPVVVAPGAYATDPEIRDALTRQAIMPAPGEPWYEDYPHRWLASTVLISERLKLRDPFKVEDSNTGNLMTDEFSAASALEELLTIPPAWPSSDEIIEYEEQVVDFTTSLLVQRGRTKTDKFLMECFRLLRSETTAIVNMARARAKDLTAADIEEKKAVMELMLEDLAQRCKKNNELRTELGVYKTLAVVQGIARADVEDDGDIFAKVVKRSAAHVQDRVVEGRSQLLPAPSDPNDATDD